MVLRLAVWNCNMRLHAKLEALRILRPGVLVMPECACPEVLYRRVPGFPASSCVWTGRRPSKGLAVFGFDPWRIEADGAHDPRGETTAVVRVRGPADFRLLAAWEGRGRREPLARAVERVAGFLAGGPAAIAGDFNAALDGGSPLARRLEAMGFRSAYRLIHGEEREPTLFVRRRTGVRGHRDVILVDRRLARAVTGAAVGARGIWTGASDHAPVVAELDPARFC